MNTLSYRRAHGLTIRQENAVDLVAAGLHDAAAAERVGVARETLTRWRLYDPAFRTALSARRAELWTGAADGLRAAIPLALDTIREQLGIGVRRDRLALDLLTRSGFIGQVRISDSGPTRIEDILDAEVRRARARTIADYGQDTCMLPPVDAPVTDDEREAAYLHLMALAADESATPGEPLDPPPTDHK